MGDLKKVLTKGQYDALGAMLSGDNVALYGYGGTGKSYLLEGFVKISREVNGKNVLILAPTGAAAEKIDGITIHRALRIGIGPMLKKPQKNQVTSCVRDADIIIIDEISMVRLDIFDYLWQVIELANEIRDCLNKSHIQVIVCGDFAQLKPVIKENHGDRESLEVEYGDKLDVGFAYEGYFWDEANFKNFMLKDIVRQEDKEQAKDISLLRVGDESALQRLYNISSSDIPENAVYLVSKNEDADRINFDMIEGLEGNTVTFKAVKTNPSKIVSGDVVARETLDLKIGARVMCIVNDNENGLYQNGSLGTVLEINKDTHRVKVKFDNGNTVNLEDYVWEIKDYKKFSKKHELETTTVATFTQIPLIPAYAQTIHKSQGQTYDSCVFVLPYYMEGQMYVAVSRTRDVRKCYFDLSNCGNRIPHFRETKSANEFYRKTFGRNF